MIDFSLRRAAFVAAAIATLSLPAAAYDDNSLSLALGDMKAPLATMNRLKIRSQTPAVLASYKSEPVTLSCSPTDGQGKTWTLRIDYSDGRIEEIGTSGRAIRSGPAKISDNAITWRIAIEIVEGPPENRWSRTETWGGNIDRLSGNGWIQVYTTGGGDAVTVACRKATPVI